MAFLSTRSPAPRICTDQAQNEYQTRTRSRDFTNAECGAAPEAVARICRLARPPAEAARGRLILCEPSDSARTGGAGEARCARGRGGVRGEVERRDRTVGRPAWLCYSVS